MEIVYQGKKVEIEDGANGFLAAKALDPEKKNKAQYQSCHNRPEPPGFVKHFLFIYIPISVLTHNQTSDQ